MTDPVLLKKSMLFNFPSTYNSSSEEAYEKFFYISSNKKEKFKEETHNMFKTLKKSFGNHFVKSGQQYEVWSVGHQNTYSHKISIFS